ncbi:hypothetical protein ABZV78_25300 [Micromonospora sp. NPDC004540]|uniref:hypothetical protein n=1 Tax=Micromonospora sp. NPDC004540 TaxID=3154457 RepID=UPI0033A97714
MNELEELASPAALADLARAGHLMARQSFMQVTFEVHHVEDRGGYLRELLSQRVEDGRKNAPAEGEPAERVADVPRETLSSAANGVGLVIGTYAGALPPEMEDRRQGSDLPVALRVQGGPSHARLFQGTASPNPSFIYESVHAFEGMIVIGERIDEWSNFHGRAVAEAIAEISAAATDRGAPLLSLQSPVQLPADRDQGEWPVPAAIAVRFSMALRHSGADVRLDLAERFARYADERGYGFWVADSRPGHRQGNWCLVQPPDKVRADQSAEWGHCDDIMPTYCLPITFVGPAHVGSTNAIMSYLREFPDLGVLASSIISLDDLAFIHFQLAVNRLPVGGISQFEADLDAVIPSRHVDDTDGRTSAPQYLLPKILPLVTGSVGKPRDEKLARMIDRAGNYQSLTGPALRVRFAERDGRVPLWFSWQAADTDDGLAVPLIALTDALRAIGLVPADDTGRNPRHPNLDYLVCREVGESTLRGKGKISLPRHVLHDNAEPNLETIRARLCTSLEDAWRAALRRQSLPGGVEVAVAWAEFRLNNWTAAL